MKRSVVPPAAAGLLAALCVWGVGLATASPSAAREHGAQTHGAQTHRAQTGRAQTHRAQTGTKARSKPAGADLLSYKNCAQLLDQVKAEALKEVGPMASRGRWTGTPAFPRWGWSGAPSLYPRRSELTRRPLRRRPRQPTQPVPAPPVPAPATPAIRPLTTRRRASTSPTW